MGRNESTVEHLGKVWRELEYGHTISQGKSTPPREDWKQFGKSTGRNESTAELLVKVWEGIRKFLDVPKESTGSFFRHMRVFDFLQRQIKKSTNPFDDPISYPI